MLLTHITVILIMMLVIMFVGYKAYSSACYYMDHIGIKIKVTSLIVLTISLCIVEFSLIKHLLIGE